MRLFDAHCHLQDSRISAAVVPQLIDTAIDSGILHFAVDGTSENDWQLVKEMGEEYPSVIPNFGLHPWFISGRSPDWFESLKGFMETTPPAAVGEIGLHKDSNVEKTVFSDQVEVFRPQLALAKDLGKPVSVHCVNAFDELLEIMKEIGPFPAGLIMHSYIGSAQMVPPLADLGTYFSISGHLTSMKPSEAKKILKAIPLVRILLETDAPDGLPKWDPDSLIPVPGDESGLLNHPANLHTVLNYVATMLEMPEKELAEVSYQNAVRIFSFPGSKLCN